MSVKQWVIFHTIKTGYYIGSRGVVWTCLSNPKKFATKTSAEKWAKDNNLMPMTYYVDEWKCDEMPEVIRSLIEHNSEMA